jgi:hydrogenase maturation protease
MTALVIGTGSLLRGDDAVGRRASEAVAGWNLPGVSTLSVTQWTPELAEPLASASLAVFIDASVAPEGDATVEVRPVEPSGHESAFGHLGDPGSLLALARSVFGACPEAWLVTIPAAELSLSEGLSPTAERGLAEALRRVADLLRVHGVSMSS